VIEVSLTHDGRWWVAWNESFTVRGRTLVEIDRAVADELRQRESSGPEREVAVRMSFDRTAIPEWIRQYSQHYFNRLVVMDLRPRVSARAVTEGE